MDLPFEPTDTQALMHDSLQRWLGAQAGFSRRAALLATPDAIAPVWHGLAEDLGLLGAALPESLGGAGGGLADQLLVSHALGQALLPEPYAATAVLGAALLQALAPAAGDAQVEPLLRGIAQGQVRLALAALEPGARVDLADVRSRLQRVGAGPRVTGRKAVVRAAPWATHWLVTARDDAGALRVALVDPAAPGTSSRAYRLSDGAWAAELAFDAAPVTAVLGTGDALPALERATDLAMLATGAEAVGVMQRLMRETIDHLRQRRQFGQPLAAFQVLQHRLADMHLLLVQASAAVGACTDLADPALPAADRARRAASAHVAVLRAARAVGQGAVQLHGGMGMTDELAIGHGFKRLTVIGQQFGGLDHHLRRVVDLAS